MDPYIKVNIVKIWDMVEENYYYLIHNHIKDFFKMISIMDKESTLFMTKLNYKEISEMESLTDNAKFTLKMVIFLN